MNKIHTGGVPVVNLPRIPDNLKKAPKWAFSFKYFNQVQYFGLSESDPKWFVALLNRFRDLCKQDIESFFRDYTTRDAYRYHRIDWDAKNIPIQREECNWIEKHYLHNDVEYPFIQFQISQSLGRVIGFWDEGHTVFHIVLLDPLHNMQPAKSFGYKVDDCYPLSCHHSSLLIDIERLKQKQCSLEGCHLYQGILTLPTRLNNTNIVMGHLEDEYMERLEKAKTKFSLSEIIEFGLLMAEEEMKGA